MSFDSADDGLVRLLSTLPVAASEPRRSTNVRERCHEALARRAGTDRRPRLQRSAKLLIVLGALYAAELTRLVVAFYQAAARPHA